MRRFLSPGFLSVTIVAVLAGLLGVYVFRSLASGPAPLPPRPRSVDVPLASADLPAGRVIVLGDVAIMPMSVAEMRQKGPLDVLMLSSSQIIGRRLKRPLAGGQAFLTTDLYLEGSGPELNELLKPGLRAISLEVPTVRGGSVSPGQTVDVLFRSEPRRGTDRQTEIPERTVVLFEGVEVLSVVRPQVDSLQAAVGYQSKDPMVTLAVTPEQAARLHAVEGRGDISLAVRPPREFVAMAAGSAGISLEEILGVTPPPPADASAVPPQRLVSEIYRRASRQTNTFTWQRGWHVDQAGRNTDAYPVGPSPDLLGPADVLPAGGPAVPQGRNAIRSGS